MSEKWDAQARRSQVWIDHEDFLRQGIDINVCSVDDETGGPQARRGHTR